MKSTLRLCLVLVLYLPDPSQPVCDDSFGDIWQPSWATGTRTEMRCSKQCAENQLTNSDSETDEKCCTCHTCMNWEGREIDLFIEYVSVSGRSLVLFDQAPNETEVYKIEHTDSEMTEIPSNICNWDNETNLQEKFIEEFDNKLLFWKNLVQLNFQDNKIRKLPDINCLIRLDELNLRNNRLAYISNTSFTKLTLLRSVDFSGNLIQSIQPNILASPFLSIFSADFSYNKMTKIDVTNMMSLHPFCNINFESNEISEIVNDIGFKLDPSKTYGPGYVSIEDNLIKKWPDFKELLFLDNLSQLGTLFSFGFNFQGIPLTCDCNLEPFLTLAKDIIEIIWLDYFNVKCTAPDNLAGIPVHEVDPVFFTCPLTADSDCQTPECTCVDKPNEETLFIDCHNSGLTQWPKIPQSKFSKFVSLNISGNQITKFENSSYLPKLSMLDISGNNLLEIDPLAAELLENASYIDISNNPNLKSLPQTFQYHNVCSRHMRNLQVRCDCQTLWIEQWLQSKTCESYNHLFTCNIPDVGVKPAHLFSESDLKCFSKDKNYMIEIVTAAFILLLIIAGIFTYNFRYELLIIYLRLQQRRRNTVYPLYKYDVFLSFNEADDSICPWVDRTLEPYLINKGYKVFQASRDVAFGSERNSEIINIISKTRNFLTIMSENYFENANEGACSWTENEWKHGWNHFKQDKCKKIVLINFDHLSSFNVSHLQIKAYLRVGYTINFENRDRKILENICNILGKPFRTEIPRLSYQTYQPYHHFVTNYVYNDAIFDNDQSDTQNDTCLDLKDNDTEAAEDNNKDDNTDDTSKVYLPRGISSIEIDCRKSSIDLDC